MSVTATILSAGRPMSQAYELVSIDVTKEVNRIPYAQIILIDGDIAQQTFVISDTDFFAPGKPIEIKLRYEGEPEPEAVVFKGVVVGHGVQADQHGSLLTIELKDAAVKLTSIRKSAIYRDQTDTKAIDLLIMNSGLKKGPIATTRVQHPQLVQYYCTDWDFILARAEANSLLVHVDNGEISLAEMIVQGKPKHSFKYGLTEIFSFEIDADGGSQYPQVQSIAWDVKNQKLTQAAKAKDVKLDQGNLNAGSIAKSLGFEPYVLTNPIPLNPKELQAWADATLARSRASMIRGRIAVPGLSDVKLLDVIEVSGVSKRFNGKTLVTGIRHRVDQHGWQTDLQFGLSAERFTQQPDIVDAPAAGLLPAINGLHIGIVGMYEEDPEKEFRIQVILPGIDAKNGTLWARLASPDAGNNRGYFFRPEPGDEVVVGFFNDDPRQAVILGAMYGSKNKPPKDVAKLTKENKAKTIVTKTGATIGFLDGSKSSVFIKTPDANTIKLDDDAKAITITDQHGNTITMNKDGVEIKSAKDVKINASGNVEIKGAKVDIK
jgi:Rhs element Vgr protein